MPHLLALLFLRHEPAPIDYNIAMVALIESRLICSDLLRAHPRERGTILSTKAETVPALFPLQASTDTQRLQGESLSFTASLHPPNQSNQQYSILSLSDSSGAVVERVAYQAYGQQTFTNASGTTLSTNAKATRYSYTGREWDASLQLHHFRARWMSGLSGRMWCRDPARFLGGLNFYAFVRNSSFNYIDPSGLWDVLPKLPLNCFAEHYRKVMGRPADFWTNGCIGIARDVTGKALLFDKETECFLTDSAFLSEAKAIVAKAEKKCSPVRILLFSLLISGAQPIRRSLTARGESRSQLLRWALQVMQLMPTDHVILIRVLATTIA